LIANITGVVFNDVDSSGTQDPGEVGIGGVLIQLLDSITNAVVATTTTAANGSYQFLNVPPGDYQILETDPASYSSTTANAVTISVALGQTANGDFGDRLVATCGNGILETGETCEPTGRANPPNGNPCRSDCTFCGDGIVNGPPGRDDPGHETCDDGDTSNFNACTNSCVGRILRDPAVIRFRRGRRVHDVLTISGRIRPQMSFDPSNQEIGVVLSDSRGVIYKATVGEEPPGRPWNGRRYKYRQRFARKRSEGGIETFQFIEHGTRGILVKIKAHGDLSGAVDPDMKVQIFIGNQVYTSTGAWQRLRFGWYLHF
jgi:hypothetical protein